MRQASYLPSVTLTASLGKFDDKFFPTLTNRRSIGFSIALPIWDGGQRELAIQRLKTNRTVARAIREDLERSARRDVTEAYTGYDVSRRALDLAQPESGSPPKFSGCRTPAIAPVPPRCSNCSTRRRSWCRRRPTWSRRVTRSRLARASLEVILGQRLTPDSERSTP